MVFLVDFGFYMPVLGVGMGSIGLVAPVRFKMFESKPGELNMDVVSTVSHDLSEVSEK